MSKTTFDNVPAVNLAISPNAMTGFANSARHTHRIVFRRSVASHAGNSASSNSFAAWGFLTYFLFFGSRQFPESYSESR